MSLYRHYDKEALDAQYNNRALVPDHPAILERWQADSRAARERLACLLDVPYGSHARQRLDLFPAGPASPIVVWIHGGYWQALDKGWNSFLAPGFVAAGISFAAVGYRLAPEVGIDAIVDDVRTALAWIVENAGQVDGDPGRLVVAGHSAGGHLAAMMALDRGMPPLLGAVCVSGLYELEPLRLSYVNDLLRLDAAAAARNSPTLLASGAPTGPALLLAVGGAESAEYHRQMAGFAAALRAAGRPVETSSLAGLNHFTILDAIASADGALGRAIRDRSGPVS